MTKAENKKIKLMRSQLIVAITETERLLPGTIISRMMRCGKKSCKCNADPPELHGPYVQWTYIHKGKQVTHWLNTEQQARYCKHIQDGSKLRKLLSQLEEYEIISVEHTEGWGAQND